MEWSAVRIDRDAIDLEAGAYLCTVYPPTRTVRHSVFMDMRGAQGRLRTAYIGTLEELPTDIKGDYRRSIHRPALEALHRQWTAQGLRALAHTRYGQCGMWCRGSVCPLSTLQQQAHTQQD